MKLPLISVVIPSYNKDEYIERTLRSIVDQKYTSLEIIIQDGGSTDGSVEIIKNYAEKYPEIIRWESKKDNGQVDAINKGLRKSKGEIVTFINADDTYSAGALIKVGKYFVDNPACLWVAGEGEIINDKEIKIFSAVTRYKNFLLKLNKYWLLKTVNYLIQPSVFLSRHAYNKFGPFGGTRKYVLEYELWLNLGKTQMPGIIPQNLSCFRLTPEGISLRLFKEVLQKDYEIVKKYTNSRVVLAVHKLHNWGRIGAAYVSKLLK